MFTLVSQDIFQSLIRWKVQQILVEMQTNSISMSKLKGSQLYADVKTIFVKYVRRTKSLPDHT